MKFIVGKKVEMTQVWRDDKVIGVTKVQVGPCTVAQIKNEKADGYSSVQVTFGQKKEKNIRKPQLGHLRDLPKTGTLREFRATADGLEKGDVIKADTFEVGDIVDVIGTSKGKGFQGVVKRHGFKGTKASHGNKDQLRMPGSIGATGPAHVFKGTRMGGRMGGDRVTTKNLEIIEVDLENNLIMIKGAVPGARNSLVMVNCAGDLKFSKPEVKEVKEEAKEEVAKEVKEEVKVEEVKTEKAPKTEEAKEVKEDVKAEAKTEEAKTEKK